MDKDCLIYISGPMTGLPEENYPAFFQAEKLLKVAGFPKVYNPANVEKQDSWQGYMDIHLPVVRRATFMALLPGWGESKGSRLEVQEAYKYGVVVDHIQNFLALAPDEIGEAMQSLLPAVNSIVSEGDHA